MSVAASLHLLPSLTQIESLNRAAWSHRSMFEVCEIKLRVALGTIRANADGNRRISYRFA